MKFLRAGFRFVSALILFLCAYLDYIFFIKLRGRASSLQVRAGWLQFWSRNLLRILHIDVKWEGTPPSRGLMVSNHLGYVDVLVYGSICPLIFLSKAEVSAWPIAGPLTRCAGTLYIWRQQRSDVKRLGADIEPVVKAGMVVVLFLEGTSSDGSQVLPFRPSLLAPAEEHGWPVTPAWIHYAWPDGTKAEHVAYWGDATFFTHFLRLLGEKRVEAHARFGEPVTEKLSRKEMAQGLRDRICRMKDEYGSKRKPAEIPAKQNC